MRGRRGSSVGLLGESWVKQEFSGALNLLYELKSQYTLAYLTNTNSIQWPIIQETMKIEENSEHQFVSHLMGKVKPIAETFEHVVKILSVPAKYIMFFDDSARNVLAASTIGMTAHQVKGIGETRSALIGSGLIDCGIL